MSEIEALDQEILEAKEALNQSEKDHRRYIKVREELEREKAKLRSLKKELEGKKGDHDSSLEYFAETVFGDREESPIDEEMEYYQLELAVESSERIIEDLEKESDELMASCVEKDQLKEDYEALLEKKKELLLDDNTEESELILEYSEKIADVRSNMKELEEAASAGQDLINSLQGLIDAIDEAEGEKLKLLVGYRHTGRSLSDYLQEVKSAKSMVYSIEYNLQAYTRELSDLEYIINEDLETRTFEEQADKISNCLSGRLMVHFRMGDARDTAEGLIREVSSPLPMIDDRKEELKAIEEKLTRNLNEYIENV